MATLFFSGNASNDGSGSAGSWEKLVEAAFNRAADFALRDDPVWSRLVDTKPTKQDKPGDTVTFTIHQDLGAAAVTPLQETVAPANTPPQAPNRVTVTLNEYGRVTTRTEFLTRLNFTDAEMEQAVIVGRDMVDQIDSLIRGVADGSTNGLIANSASGDSAAAQGTTTSSITNAAGAYLFGRGLSATVVSYLRGKKVAPKAGSNYLIVAHPHVLHDLMASTSVNSWAGPHTYGGDTGAVYSASVGTFMGAEFLSTTRITTANDGSTGAKVYRSYGLGQQALAEAVSYDPHIVVGEVTDPLRRFAPLGWKFLGGYALYRPEALVKMFSSSSLAAFT